MCIFVSRSRLYGLNNYGLPRNLHRGPRPSTYSTALRAKMRWINVFAPCSTDILWRNRMCTSSVSFHTCSMASCQKSPCQKPKELKNGYRESSISNRSQALIYKLPLLENKWGKGVKNSDSSGIVGLEIVGAGWFSRLRRGRRTFGPKSAPVIVI
ncbi:hypothetical protein EVAR_18831_1 [Eumeta japonica]|uniref:Uncharacterized protein n=1 Tax=Eumeta variegata TaxID=151549 RepID=A0A4C1ULQ6_EUMVA|nr:hypothetical protein EVAR_18831_1 [Eumeta japonica]